MSVAALRARIRARLGRDLAVLRDRYAGEMKDPVALPWPDTFTSGGAAEHGNKIHALPPSPWGNWWREASDAMRSGDPATAAAARRALSRLAPLYDAAGKVAGLIPRDLDLGDPEDLMRAMAAVVAVAVPGLWPPDVPLPLTAGDALDLVESEADRMAAELAEGIAYFARELVLPELVDAVLAREDVGERWPWPEDWPERPGGPGSVNPGWSALDVLLGDLHPAKALERSAERGHVGARPMEGGDLRRYWWPGEAAPLDVARWARDALNRLESGRGDGEAEKAEAGLILLHRPFVAPSGAVLPGGGLALLYLAEREARKGEGARPAAPEMFLVSVEAPAVRTMVALGGGHPKALGGGGLTVRGDPGDPVRLTFKWADRDPTQLDLEDLVELPPGAGPLVAVARAFGDAAVRDVLALYLFTWAARAPAGTGVWWWPDEHLEVVGLNPGDKSNLRRRRELLDRLNRSRLEAHYQTGAPLDGPVVGEMLRDGTARLIHLHPAMYRGVMTPGGDLGSYWWGMPVELLRLPADRTAGRVHVLAPVLARSWRAAWSDQKRKRQAAAPEARIGTRKLARMLAIKGTTGEGKRKGADARAAKTLQVSLDAAVKCGLVGAWRVKRGDLERLTGTVYATAGGQTVDLLRGGGVPRPARLPATGGELDRWRQASGLTFDEAAAVLKIHRGTLGRVVYSHRDRPLPPSVRGALRRYLWPEG